MMRRVNYDWRLRAVMAERGMYSTTDLTPLLQQRGINLSATQIYRLVTGTPERLNMAVLAAICDALDCAVGDLIGVSVSEERGRRTATGDRPEALGKSTQPVTPIRAVIKGQP